MSESDHHPGRSKRVAPVRLTRRQGLGAAGAGVALLLARGPLAPFDGAPASATAADCVLVPEKMEGPYFVDELLNRRDIRSDSDGTNTQRGVPLELTMRLLNSDRGCTVGRGVIVDVWQCNAAGDYSDIAGVDGIQGDTLGHDYLRGFQVTDAKGRATFKTIYPGWYEGRTIHIHFKVRAFDGDATTYEFSSQLFFDQATNNAVNRRTALGYEGVKATTNAADAIYGGDSELLVPLSGSVHSGYRGAITIGLSGLPAGSDVPGGGGDRVDAELIGARARSDEHGRRRLIAKLRAGERVDVKLRLIRGRKVIARGSGKVGKGRHEVRLRIPAGADAGPATLKATFEDGTGNVARSAEKVRIPPAG